MIILLSALIAAAPPEQAANASPDKDPIVCTRRAQAAVGTNMKGKRICMRKSEWAEVEAHTKREMRTITDRQTHPGLGLGR